jgi:hypothetical protein
MQKHSLDHFQSLVHVGVELAADTAVRKDLERAISAVAHVVLKHVDPAETVTSSRVTSTLSSAASSTPAAGSRNVAMTFQPRIETAGRWRG